MGGWGLAGLWQESAGLNPGPRWPTLPAVMRDRLLGPRARRLWLALFIALCAATLVLALLPATRAPEGTGWDKLDHALAFAVLAVAGVLAIGASPAGTAGVLVGLAALGGGIEWLQGFVPSRQGDLADFVADLAGAAAGTLLAWLLARSARQARP